MAMVIPVEIKSTLHTVSPALSQKKMPISCISNLPKPKLQTITSVKPMLLLVFRQDWWTVTKKPVNFPSPVSN